MHSTSALLEFAVTFVIISVPETLKIEARRAARQKLEEDKKTAAVQKAKEHKKAEEDKKKALASAKAAHKRRSDMNKLAMDKLLEAALRP